MALATLTDEEAKELYRLHRLYYREARKCETAKAYLAGCVLLGSALETMLMLMVNVFPEEAEETGNVPQGKHDVKPLREWRFVELLRVVKAAGWLPAGLDVDKGEWNGRKARIGDWAEVARMVRNLVHPARYMADHPGGRSTLSRLRWQFEVVDLCRDWLLAHVRRSLRVQMEAEGLLSARKSRATRSGGKALKRRDGGGSVDF